MSNRTLNLYQHSLWALLASLFECEGSLYFPCRLLTVQISSRDRVSSLSCQYWRGHLLQAQKWRELISFLSFSEAHRLRKKSSVKFLPLLFSSPVSLDLAWDGPPYWRSLSPLFGQSLASGSSAEKTKDFSANFRPIDLQVLTDPHRWWFPFPTSAPISILVRASWTFQGSIYWTQGE